MFGRKKETPKCNVYLKLRIASTVVSDFCGQENAAKLLNDDGFQIIKKAKRLNSYDNFIQKAEATLINHNPELWYHHGCSTFASSPNMIIDIDESTDQLQFKVVDNWFTLETTDYGVCVFFAPTTHFRQLVDEGHLGYVGTHGIEDEIQMPGEFKWLEGIHQKIDGGLTNREFNGIDVTYTNEAAQLVICRVFEGGEHPVIRD